MVFEVLPKFLVKTGFLRFILDARIFACWRIPSARLSQARNASKTNTRDMVNQNTKDVI
jgi:hypothetical protein